MPKLTIYSHNVCWTRRRKSSSIIASKIEELQPDIVCLQECGFPSQIKNFNVTGYFQSYSKLQKSFIRSTLSIMNKEKLTAAACGGLVTLTHTKPIKVDYIKFNKQGAIFSLQLAERAIQKGFLVVELDNFIIINTHLTSPHKRSKHDSQKIHDSQTDQIIDYVKQQIKPVIISGDFHFSEKNNNYLKLSDLAFRDISSYVAMTFLPWKNKTDYILINFKPFMTECNLVNFIQKQPSDHFAIMAEIEY